MSKKLLPTLNILICLGLAFILISFSLILGIFPQSSAQNAVPSTITERRGVWLTNVSSSVLFIPGSVNRVIKQLSRLQFNTVYPVVWNRGYTFYPSSLAKEVIGKEQEPLLKVMGGGTDVLSAIIKESHHRGIQVIPWFEYGLMIPRTSPLAQRHRDWLTQSQQSNLSLKDYQTEEEVINETEISQENFLDQWIVSSRRRRVSQLAWLNPLHREVQQFIKELMLEVVMNYDVDGVQIDDHFGFPVELGYDPLTVKLYQQEHRGKSPPNDPHNPEWMRWRAAKLTAFMAELQKNLKIAKPGIKISLSPNSHRFSYQNYLQDWKTWVQRGLIDELILQVYRDNLDSFQQELQQPAIQFARQKIPVSVGILSGTLNKPITIETIKQQVKVVRDRGFDGVSFFYWESLWGYLSPESPYQRRQAFRTLFKDTSG